MTATEGSGRLEPARWDLACRVVDNLGDAAVMWRLARQLAVEHGRRVRLFIDQPAVLTRLVPAATVGACVQGVAIHRLSDDPEAPEPVMPEGGDADVVVTGFHAALPGSWRSPMLACAAAWINLEYLSAEDWIEEFHCLPRPHADGLTEYFFYPGFTVGSGGLLRESDLMARRAEFHRHGGAARFLAGLGVWPEQGETIASLLCYPDAPLDALARLLAEEDVRLHLLVPDGAAAGAGDEPALEGASRGRLRITRIPFLPQHEYDALLWSCDLNFVRGEDSLVRAVWSGNPFVWQIYRQEADAHLPKLEAFLRLLPGKPLADAIRWWNQVPGSHPAPMRELVARPQEAVESLRLLAALPAASDLSTRLLAFVRGLDADPHRGGWNAGKLQ